FLPRTNVLVFRLSRGFIFVDVESSRVNWGGSEGTARYEIHARGKPINFLAASISPRVCLQEYRSTVRCQNANCSTCAPAPVYLFSKFDDSHAHVEGVDGSCTAVCAEAQSALKSEL
ncbi:unnamed protein product, partial [Hapterophycus canaliculatus]